MFLKNLAPIALAACMVASSPVAHARGFDLPFKPTAGLMVSLQSINVWAELYDVRPNEVEPAVERAKRGEPPAMTLTAAIANWALHATVDKKSLVLNERTSELSRAGEPIDYSECQVTPRKGDRLEVSYGKEGSGYEVKLDAQVVEYLSYGEAPGVLLDVTKLEECQNETSSRMFLQGTLTLTKNGTLVQSRPVLVQSIVEPE